MLKIDDIVRLRLIIGTAAVSADAYDTGLILGSSDVISATDRIKAYTSLESVLEGGFAATTPEYRAAEVYFAQDPAPAKLYIGRIAGSGQDAESATTALEACMEKAGDFYGVYVCTVSDAEILAINTLLENENRGMLYYAATGTYAAATGANGILAKAHDTESRRLFGVFADDALTACAVMGRMAGLSRAHKNGSFSLCYKSLNGISPVSVTEEELTAIKALNGNAYVLRGYSYQSLEQAATASGLRADEVMYLDAIRAEIQQAVFGLMANNDVRLPQNDQTNALFISAITGVLERFYVRQILGTGVWKGASVAGLNTGDSLDKGYYVHVDSFNNQSAEDRAERKGMPITVCLCLAGSVESVEITVIAQR
ncbi:MAG: DUF3383 family protein [Oscillospiraceae bacterium]|nr:DUF3383 family protein [Oscillospiraceae bacterium]